MRKCKICKKETENTFDYKDKTHYLCNQNCIDNFLIEQNKCPICKRKIHHTDYIIYNNKYYHSQCYEENKIKLKNNQDWEKLYFFVKKRILQYPDEIRLSSSQILSLKNLTQEDGTFLQKNKKQNYKGYTYEDIYDTFVMQEHNILNALKTKNFKDEKHKLNYCIAIVKNNINNLIFMKQEKIKTQEQLKKLNLDFQNDKKEEHFVNNYEKKSKLNNNLIKLLEEEIF